MDGHDVDDWLQAEAQVSGKSKTAGVDVTELVDGSVGVNVMLPKFIFTK